MGDRLGFYGSVAWLGFRRQSTYRAAAAAGFATAAVFGLILLQIRLAVFDGRYVVGAFTAEDIVVYTWLVQGLLAIRSVPIGLGARVLSGDVAVDLYRPIDLQAYWLATFLGSAAFQLVARAVPILLVATVVYGLEVPGIDVVAVFCLSLVLAVVLSFAIDYLVAMSAFWLLDPSGAGVIVGVIRDLLAGALIPITFFPGWLESVARMLPFAATVQAPVEIYLGHHPGTAAVTVLAVQAVWLVLMVGAGRRVDAAVRRLVIQGG